MSQLALFGGEPEASGKYREYRVIGEEELKAVERVVRSGSLSGFLGTWSDGFYGGPTVREFEQRWQEKFLTKHAISMNSATSCLYAAIGAIGVGPGDEVIVSPFTMSASAAAILIYNAIPVFADIDPKTFNLDPRSVEQRISEHTKALMVPNIFGYSAAYYDLVEIARKHDLRIIEDNAQSILASYRGRLTGTIGDIGVFSLNYHKHIHTGEGGVCVTNDDGLAERMQLIRNHAEAVVAKKGVSSLVNMLGFNFRMTEIEAAIGLEQLAKCEVAVSSRRVLANALERTLGKIAHLATPIVEDNCSHSYYVYPFVYHRQPGMPHRDRIVEALNAEGVPVSSGYVEPLYLQPMYQHKIAYGDKGCPFSCPFYKGSVSYAQGICPVAERFHYEELFYLPMCSYDFSELEIAQIARAIIKVFSCLDDLTS